MRTSRRLLFALSLCLSLAATFLATPQPSQALISSCPLRIYYYSDPAHTRLVGYTQCNCACICSTSGVTTGRDRVVVPMSGC
jgi:hypothetical protein